MKAAQRRDAIVDAAKAVFSRKGYRATSITDIMEECRVGRGTFYLHFKSKQELFIFIIESYFGGLMAVLDGNHEAMLEALKQPRDIVKAWRENLYRILVYHQQEPHLSRIIYREALGKDADFSDRFQKLAACVTAKIGDELQIMLEKSLIRECDVPITASAFLSSVVGVIIDFIVDRGDVDIDYMADEIISHHTRALMPAGMDLDAALRNAGIGTGKKKRGR